MVLPSVSQCWKDGYGLADSGGGTTLQSSPCKSSKSLIITRVTQE